MAGIEEFVATPSDCFLDRCTKNQLLQIADKYGIGLSDLSDKRKDSVKATLKLHGCRVGLTWHVFDMEVWTAWVPCGFDLASMLLYRIDIR